MSDARNALNAYVEELHCDYERWYDKSACSAYRWYVGMQSVSILSAFITSIIAAFVDQNMFDRGAKIALIAVPLIGGLAGTVMIQTKLYDMWRLRENGRILFQGLVSEGRLRMAAAQTEEEYSSIHADLQKRAQDAETQQSATFFGFFSSDYVAQYKPS
jgi:hypothetical protein